MSMIPPKVRSTRHLVSGIIPYTANVMFWGMVRARGSVLVERLSW